jgi:hypothetical protein
MTLREYFAELKSNNPALYEKYKAEQRERYHRNKITRLAYQNQYNANNKDKIREYHQENKERINQYQSNYIKCICGESIRRDGIPKHKRTQKHIKLIEHNQRRNELETFMLFFELPQL